ncbi:MAG: hypothetical protein ACR5LF_15330 [Symbiopectobacterium sp.]
MKEGVITDLCSQGKTLWRDDSNEVKIIKRLKIYKKKIALRLLAKIDAKQLIAAGTVFHTLY